MSSDTNQNSDTKTNPQIHEYTSIFLSNNSPLGFNVNKNLYVQKKKKKKQDCIYEQPVIPTLQFKTIQKT